MANQLNGSDARPPNASQWKGAGERPRKPRRLPNMWVRGVALGERKQFHSRPSVLVPAVPEKGALPFIRN